MKRKRDYVVQQLKKEVEQLFASSRIQSIFEETFTSDPRMKPMAPFSDKNPASRPVSENLPRQNFTIRKRSMDYKDKGLIVPATNLSYTPQPVTGTFSTMSQIQSTPAFLMQNQFAQHALPFPYGAPLRILPMMPSVQVYQPGPVPNLQSMNIVNNYTNIQNFSSQKEPKNVHIYRLKDAVRSASDNKSAPRKMDLLKASAQLYRPSPKREGSEEKAERAEKAKPEESESGAESNGLLEKRGDIERGNGITEFLLENRRKGVFGGTSDFAEKKLLMSMSSKVNVFWKRENNTYPFTFKQKKLVKNSSEDLPILMIERQQFNFKRVNPNQHLHKKN